MNQDFKLICRLGQLIYRDECFESFLKEALIVLHLCYEQEGTDFQNLVELLLVLREIKPRAAVCNEVLDLIRRVREAVGYASVALSETGAVPDEFRELAEKDG